MQDSGSNQLSDMVAGLPGVTIIDPENQVPTPPPSPDDLPGGPPLPVEDANPPKLPGEGDEPPVVPNWFDAAKPVFTELFGEEIPDQDKLRERIKQNNEELVSLREVSKTYNKTSHEQQQQRITELEAENGQLMQDVNPLTHFSSEDSYRAEQLKKIFPAYNRKAVEELASTDLEKMDVLKAIRLNYQLNYGKDDVEWQNKCMEKDYGAEFDEDGNLVTVEPVMERAAMDIIKEFKKIKETEIPKVKDYRSIVEQRTNDQKVKVEKLKTDWKPVMEAALTNLKKLTIPFMGPDGKTPANFDFVLEEQATKPYIEHAVELMATSGREPNEENLKSVMQSVVNNLMLTNLTKIATAYANARASEIDELWATETNNPRKINQAQKPKEPEVKKYSKEAAEKTILDGWS